MYVKHQNKTAGIVQMAHFIINVSKMCKHEIPNKKFLFVVYSTLLLNSPIVQRI